LFRSTVKYYCYIVSCTFKELDVSFVGVYLSQLLVAIPLLTMIHLFAVSFIFHVLTVWNHVLCLFLKQKFIAVKSDFVLLNFLKSVNSMHYDC